MLFIDPKEAQERAKALPPLFKRNLAFFHNWQEPENWISMSHRERMWIFGDLKATKNGPMPPAEPFCPDASWVWAGSFHRVPSPPQLIVGFSDGDFHRRKRQYFPRFRGKAVVRILWETLMGELSPAIRLIPIRHNGRSLVAHSDVNIYRYLPGMRDLSGRYMGKDDYFTILGISETPGEDPMEGKVRDFLLENAPVAYDENDNEYRDYDSFFSLPEEMLVNIVVQVNICHDRELIVRVIKALKGEII